MDTAEMIAMAYLDDLTDEELLVRPAEGANHILWQLGHLVASEHQMLSQLSDPPRPPLPEGFADRYHRDQAAVDDPAAFDSREQLMQLYREQRDATLAQLDQLSDEQLDEATPEEMQGYAPTVGAALAMQGTHWTMHSGQWAVIRRQLGRPPVF